MDGLYTDQTMVQEEQVRKEPKGFWPTGEIVDNSLVYAKLGDGTKWIESAVLAHAK